MANNRVLLFLLTLSAAVLAQEEIESCEALQAVADNLSGSFIQTRHISCVGSEDWNGGAGFRPIGTLATPFSGEYDGSGYEISYLTSNRTDENYVGLFGYLATTGLIKGVSLKYVRVIGKERVGGLVGQNRGAVFDSTVLGNITGIFMVAGVAGTNLGTLTNIRAQIIITALPPGERVGGLVGENTNTEGATGIVTNSSAFGTVTGNYLVGGAAGNNDGTLIAIHTQTHVIAVDPGEYIAGLAGLNMGLIADSSASGTVVGTQLVGGVAGANFGTLIATSQANITGSSKATGGLVGQNEGLVIDSAAFGAVTGTTHVGGIAGINGNTITDTFSHCTVIGIEPGWYVGGLAGYNSGSTMNSAVYGEVIGTAYVGGALGVNFGTLTAVDVEASVSGLDPAEFIGGVVGENGGTGIISNATFFGEVVGSAQIGGALGNNLGIATLLYSQGDVTGMTSSKSVGGLCGRNERLISHSTANTAVFSAGPNAGGFVGENTYTGELLNATALGNVISTADSAGGLAGANHGKIFDSLALGNVSAYYLAGGLIGVNTITALVNRSACLGVVSGTESQIGGLIGLHEGVLENSYALGCASGTHTVGALLGKNEGTLKHCYAVGCVTAENNTGGLVGGTLSSHDVFSCFWNKHSTGQRHPAGGRYDASLQTLGLSNEEIRQAETFIEWDPGTWHMIEGQLPYLPSLTLAPQPQLPTEHCPMAPLPFSAWMSELASLGTVWISMMLLWLMWRRWRTLQQSFLVWQDRWLWRVATKGDQHLLHYLLTDKPNIPTEDEQEISAIVFAARMGFLEMVDTLIKKWKIQATEERYTEALSTAQYYGYQEIITLLKPTDAGSLVPPSPVEMREGGGNLRRRAQPRSGAGEALLGTHQQHTQEEELYEAASNGHYFTTWWLLLNEAICNRVLEQYQTTPLWAAIKKGHLNTALLLVAYGAFLPVQNSRKQTVAHLLISQHRRIWAKRLRDASPEAALWPFCFRLYRQALRDNSDALTSADLSGYGLGDEALADLADAMKGNSHLTHLLASNNHFTDRGLQYLAQVLTEHAAIPLTEVDVRHTLVTQRGIDALRRAKCDLTIQWEGTRADTTVTENRWAHWSEAWQQRCSLKLALSWQRYTLGPLLGWWLIMAHRFISGFLIQDLDEQHQEALMTAGSILFIISYANSLLALRYVYGAWCPRQLLDILGFLALLPLLSPELLILIWQINYPDVALTLFSSAQLLLEVAQATLFLYAGTLEGFSAFILLKLSLTLFSILWHLAAWLHQGTTLIPQFQGLWERPGDFFTPEDPGEEMRQV